jgi:hypothetical protein
LQEARVDDEFIGAARQALTWQTVDADIEFLGLADDFAPTADALVRGSGPGAPRTLIFHGERLSVEIEIDKTGIVGQLTPPRPGRVTLVTADGPRATTQTDEVGCFTLPPPGSGSLRLDCELGGERFITEWVTV